MSALERPNVRTNRALPGLVFSTFLRDSDLKLRDLQFGAADVVRWRLVARGLSGHPLIISCSVCFELSVQSLLRVFERPHNIDRKPQSQPLPISALKTVNEILQLPSYGPFRGNSYGYGHP